RPQVATRRLPAELSLRPLERRACVDPCTVLLAGLGRLGTERGALVDDVVAQPEVGEDPCCLVPRLAVAVALRPVTERFGQPVRSQLDRSRREGVTHLLVVAPQIGDGGLEPIPLRTDLIRVPP